MKTNLVNRLSGAVAESQKLIGEFSAKLLKDPAYSLSWSDDAFYAAAKVAVLQRIITMLDASNVEDVLRVCRKEAINKARFPRASSSVVSNLMEQKVGQVWAEWSEEIELAIEMSKEKL